MASISIGAGGTAVFSVLAASKVAVFTTGVAQVYQQINDANRPKAWKLIGTVANTHTVFSITPACEISIEAGAQEVLYETGTAAVVIEVMQSRQATPATCNVTGTLGVSDLLTGIVTSTTAAVVAATLPTGAALDGALLHLQVGEAFDWSIISTGANSITIGAATGHTIVGTATVETWIPGAFRTKKTAAETYVTYRVS